MGNFNQTHLRIVTRETVFQKALRTISFIRGPSTVLETKGSASNGTVTVYTRHSWRCKARVHHHSLSQDSGRVLSPKEV